MSLVRTSLVQPGTYEMFSSEPYFFFQREKSRDVDLTEVGSGDGSVQHYIIYIKNFHFSITRLHAAIISVS